MPTCNECNHANTRNDDPPFVEFDVGEFTDMDDATPSGSHSCWSKQVHTDRPIPKNAHIMLAIRLMDCGPANLRYEITAYDIEKQGFKIRLMKWDTTILYKVRVAWAVV